MVGREGMEREMGGMGLWRFGGMRLVVVVVLVVGIGVRGWWWRGGRLLCGDRGGGGLFIWKGIGIECLEGCIYKICTIIHFYLSPLYPTLLYIFPFC